MLHSLVLSMFRETYFLNTYCVPGPVARGPLINKLIRSLLPHWEPENKQEDIYICIYIYELDKFRYTQVL